MAYVLLQWINMTNKNERGTLTTTAPINIGRAPGNDLVLVDRNASVSRRHARLIQENGRLILIDQQSTNGVYVDDNRVSKTVLKNGAKFTVGAFRIHLRRQSRCSNKSCQRLVDNRRRMCPWCGYFLADAITQEALYE